MMKTTNLRTIVLAGLFFLGFACSEDEINYTQAIQQIETQTLEGGLLKEVTNEGSHYLLQFETGSVEIPAEDIASIEMDSAKWKTVLTFSNGSTYIIPSMGSSIDELIAGVKINPSGYNPLAANVVMNLPVLGRMKVIVHSKPNSRTPDVVHLCSSLEKGQEVTVLGLYPDYTNQVELVYTDKEGNERGRSSLEIKTGGLDDIFLPRVLNVIKAVPEKMEPGMNLINSPGESETDTSVPYIVDADGRIRWVLDWKGHPVLDHIGAQCGLHRLKNGNYVTGDANNYQLVEVDVLGNVVRQIDLKALGMMYHHEIRETPDGKFLATVTNMNAKLSDRETPRILDHAAEFDPVTGEITKVWDFVELLDTARMVRADYDIPGSDLYGQSKSNWVHNNGIYICENGDMLATGRWLGVFRFSRSGRLKWVIAPHDRWRPQFEQFLLTPLDRNGDPITDEDILNGRKVHPDFEWVWGVHCPVELENGNVMVFDNGYCREYQSKHDRYYSRAVEYEIDEQAKTIRQVWSYGKEQGEEFYANAISGVQELKQTGNRLFCPGTSSPHVVEIDPKTQEVVFNLEVRSNNNMAFHRANRISLYPENE